MTYVLIKQIDEQELLNRCIAQKRIILIVKTENIVVSSLFCKYLYLFTLFEFKEKH